MESIDDLHLRKVLREWKVENAPGSLDKRVLGTARPWWKALMGGSVRVPLPVALALAVLFVIMAVELQRQRPDTAPPPPAVSPGINLAEFRPVQHVQVRIMKGVRADR